MENKFLDNAVSIVTQAVEADKNGKYEEAFTLYKKSLEHFMIGLKCKYTLSMSILKFTLDQRDGPSKDIIAQRVDGYMTRAEQLSKVIGNGGPKPVAAAGDGGGSEAEEEGGDPEKTKMRNALSCKNHNCCIYY